MFKFLNWLFSTKIFKFKGTCYINARGQLILDTDPFCGKRISELVKPGDYQIVIELRDSTKIMEYHDNNSRPSLAAH